MSVRNYKQTKDDAMSVPRRSAPLSWDASLARINNDLLALEEHCVKPQTAHSQDLYSIKNQIYQLQTQLSVLLIHIKNSAQRARLVTGAAAAWFYWVGVLSERIIQYYKNYVELHGQKMWLDLIYIRIPGSTYAWQQQFTDEQVLEISLRYHQLKKTKHQLQERLRQLEQQILVLEYRHNELQTIFANRFAAATMQGSFGSRFVEAVKNPLFNALKYLFLKCYELLDPNIQQKRQKNQPIFDRISRQTDEIMHECRDVVAHETLAPEGDSLETPVVPLQHINRTLEKIHKTEAELSRALKQIPQQSYRRRPAIIVKKNLKHGTKMSQGLNFSY